MMKKRILSFVMSLVMAFSLLPIQALAAPAGPGANKTVTVTVEDENGSLISDATVTVTYKNASRSVTNIGNGQYQFTKVKTGKNDTYTITVKKDGYKTQTVNLRGDSSAVTVTLEAIGDQWQSFKVYYRVAGLPDDYAASGDASHYGPSGDNTPMATINVNLTKLKALASSGSGGVLYFEGEPATGNNIYEFVPVPVNTSGPDVEVDEEDEIKAIQTFWDAVKSCMDAESIAAIESTGLSENFILYCLKKQSGDDPYHADGVLYVPPNIAERMFVVELYEKYSGDNKFSYFWGAVVDGTVTEGIVPEEEIKKIPSMYALLDQYELHLNQNITWLEDHETGKPLLDDQGRYSGTYIDGNSLYTIYIKQVDIAGKTKVTDWDGDGKVEGYEEYPFYVQGTGYNVARFEMTVVDSGPVTCIVTYTDGVDGEEIFYDHEYSVVPDENGEMHPPLFHEIPEREGYTFLGWWLEGDKNQKEPLTSEEVAAIDIPEGVKAMTFYAVWQLIPRYRGTVEVILDGSYNPTDGKAEGTRKDISDILKLQAADIYVSANSTDYIKLDRTAEGVYSAELENGTYSIYYSTDAADAAEKTYHPLSEQHLVMQYADRTRYLFYNSVTYDTNGGTLNGSESNYVEYHYSGNAVDVCATEPVREGYIFAGWKEGDYQELYQPNKQLTGNIERAYVLTAQWEKATDVYVTVVIKHTPESGGANNVAGMHDIAFTVDGRSGNSGDYSEMYTDAIEWDGVNADTDPKYTYAFDSEAKITTYTSEVPVLENVQADWEYTATAAKSNYEIEGVTVTEENGNKRVTLTLVYDPRNQDLTFRVELDEEAMNLPSSVWPEAVNVKINCWYDDNTGLDWNVITQHVEVYQRVELDAYGVGMGTYPVWATFTDKESGQQKPYYYRVEVVSFELEDGTIVSAHDASVCPEGDDSDVGSHVNYHAEKHLYDAEVEVRNGGGDPDGTYAATNLTGAYFDQNNNFAQNGIPTVIVSIPTFTVMFDFNDGTLNGKTEDTLEKQIFAPDVSQWIPTREGGYVFAGWLWLNDSFKLRDPLPAGAYLTENLRLIAQWLAPITVEGTVTADATYLQGTGYQEIHEVDRAKTVIVLLQKDYGNGYYETVREEKVTLTYGEDGYDEADGREVGYVKYRFTKVPQDGSYRITVLAPNYTVLYQNEPQSLTSEKVYSTYTKGMFTALLGDTGKNTATVNAHLEFEPPSFDLEYQVDASQIGPGFRPDEAEVLVTYDNGDVTVTNPADWAVISQMVFKEEPKLRGDKVDLPDGGINGSSYSVWKTSSDGASLYDYGIQVYDLKVDAPEEGGSWYNYNDYAHGEENPRFEILYQSPAHYDIQAESQSRLLVATLVPKTYSITYDLDGGEFSTNQYPQKHTWSYKTLVDLVPTRSGYKFEGWEIQVGNGTPVFWDGGVIPADTAGDIIIRAKWSRVVVNLQVVIDHIPEHGGKGANYDKEVRAQLTSRLVGESGDFQPMDGFVRTYDDTVWHTNGDAADVDVMEIPLIYTSRHGLKDDFDYNMNVSLDGYGVVESLTFEDDTDSDATTDPEVYTLTTGVEKRTVTKGGTTEIVHDVVVCLQYNPDLLQLQFNVRVENGVDESWRWPAYANVKVTCWYNSPDAENGGEGEDVGKDWEIITQHNDTVVRVPIDLNGNGTGTGWYPVWQWYNENAETTQTNQPVPFYYRIEVVSLVLQDGSIVELAEKTDEVLYAAPGYTATVEALNCGTPQRFDGTLVPETTTDLKGAYGVVVNGKYQQQGTLTAVIDMGKVVFHANRNGTEDGEVFRTYYPAAEAALVNKQGGTASGMYSMAADGNIAEFYDIPEFDYLTHNKYIFKGWYTDRVEENGTAMSWDDYYLIDNAEDVHFYAHWIETGSVEKEAADNKNTGETSYNGFDLFGVQIRDAENDGIPHYGTPGAGLRFLAAMSEDVHDTLYELSDDTVPGSFEYGFVMASVANVERAVEAYEAQDKIFELQYKGENVNGVNNTGTHACMMNRKCSGVPDHYNGENYRIYTSVITYKGAPDLTSAYSTDFAVRAYIRYYDANGLLRTYHNNYTGTAFYSGISMSYADAKNVISKAAARG